MVRRFQAEQSQEHEYQPEWDAEPEQEFVTPPDPFGEIMTRLDQLLATLGRETPVGQLGDQGGGSTHEESLIRQSRTPLPDPRLTRNVIRARQLRLRFFSPDLFADPAWDMLLDLTLARAEHRRVSVTSLCIASGVPTTTALRWIKLLEQAGLVQRIEGDTDRRRAFVALTEQGAESVARYFETVRIHTVGGA